MPEITTEVRAFETKYICDRCGIGEMKFTGQTLESYPPQYVHRCEVCKFTDNFRNKVYPKTNYEATLTDR